MLERCMHLLAHRGSGVFARMADCLNEEETAWEDGREHLDSGHTRLGLMPDPAFRRVGWPIGSEMVERANTLVVEARLTGTGMRWERTHVNPMRA